MKFSEYLDIRGGSGLTKLEMQILGVDRDKGWRKRYADFEIPPEKLNTLIARTARSKSVSTKNKARISRFTKTYEVTNLQYLYLMVSENRLKIGISKDPQQRSRTLTNASGVFVDIICIWDVKDVASIIETELHKTFKKYRLQGEWFSINFNIQDVENAISCPFSRVYFNPEAIPAIS